MPQNPTNITDSPEFKDFCKSNNLDVLNLESINVFLYEAYNKEKVYLATINMVIAKANALEEMIMEIAKNIKSPDIQQINENWNLEVTYWWTLFDKWNN